MAVARSPSSSRAELGALLRDGFLVMRGVVPCEALAALRRECNALTLAALESDSLLRRGCVLEPSEALKGKAFSSRSDFFDTRTALGRSRDVAATLPRDWLSQAVLESLLGPRCYLFNEQYISKPSKSPQSAFRVHTDSEALEDASPWYISVWLPLDPITEENGPLFFIPFARPLPEAAARDGRFHAAAEAAYGARGESLPQRQPMLALVAPGDAVVISSWVRHGSRANNSEELRRAYMPQFSAQPICDARGAPLSLAVPCKMAGVRGAQPSNANTTQQWLWFNVSGAIGTVLFYLVYEALNHGITAYGVFEPTSAAPAAWFFGYMLSIVWQHALHRWLVFGSSGNYCRSLFYTYVSYGLSIFLSSLANRFMVQQLALPHRLAWVLSLLATGVINFFTLREAFAPSPDARAASQKRAI